MKKYIIRKKYYQYDDAYYEDLRASKFVGKYDNKALALLELNRLENEAYLDYDWALMRHFTYISENKIEKIKTQLINFVKKYPPTNKTLDEEIQEIDNNLDGYTYCFQNNSQLEEYRKIWGINFYELIEYDATTQPYIYLVKNVNFSKFESKNNYSSIENIYLEDYEENILKFLLEELAHKSYIESYAFEVFLRQVGDLIFHNEWEEITVFPTEFKHFLKNTKFLKYLERERFSTILFPKPYPFNYDSLTKTAVDELNTFLGFLKIKPYELIKITESEYDSYNVKK